MDQAQTFFVQIQMDRASIIIIFSIIKSQLKRSDQRDGKQKLS